MPIQENSRQESPAEAMKLRRRIDEDQRMAALRSYRILDTLPERDFDRIVRDLRAQCRTAWALLTFVDADRQWFKARDGAKLIQTPRAVSFCSVAMHNSQPLIVEDTHRDARFNRNPLVTQDPHLRFYAGFPLFSSDGFGLGSLCVIDMKPRTLAPTQLDALARARNWVAARLEVRRHRLAEDSQPGSPTPIDIA